jgi:hypothetical protein
VHLASWQGRGRQLPDGTPQRGPAAGRAQQEARAAASQAHSADLRALAEVRLQLQVSFWACGYTGATALGKGCHGMTSAMSSAWQPLHHLALH